MTRSAAPPPQERELKLRLRAADVAPLRQRLDALAPARTEPVDSTYLDTPDRRLAGARAALRLRALGRGGRRRWVQTLKTDDSGAAFSRRGEWETAAPGGRLQPALLGDSPLAQLLARPPGAAGAGAGGVAELAPVFRTRFDRTTWDVQRHGARIEAVIDEGSIEAGSRREAIREAELELKDGPASAVWRLALGLAAGGRARASLALLPYGDSKAARGYRLAMGSAPDARGAGPGPAITADQPAAEAARLLIADDMAAVLACAAALQSAADTEWVHQARIRTRRMRAHLDVLGVELPAALERGLSRWSGRLGVVRDWDVLCDQTLPRLVVELGAHDPRRWARMAATAARRRQAATERLRRQLDAPAFAAFALRLLEWTSVETVRAGGKAARPVGAVADRAVHKRLRRLVRAGAVFARHSPQRQHRIRLQAKTVRYAIDALAAVLPSGLQGSARRALVRFQDAAGRVQDAQVALAAVKKLTRSAAVRGAVARWAAARSGKAAAKAQRLAARLSA